MARLSETDVQFASPEWVAAWLSLCNDDETFVAAGEGWEGSAGCVVRADRDRGLETLYLRLDGWNGRWTGHEIGRDPGLVANAKFVLMADYDTWRSVVRQEVHPIRAMVTGRVRVTGQLSVVLRWNKPLVMMTTIAGRLDTQFVEAPK